MITNHFPNPLNQTLNDIEELVGAEEFAIKKSLEILPPFTLFHNLILQLLVAENPDGRINFVRGVPQFTNLSRGIAKKRRYRRKLEQLIAVLEIQNPALNEMGISVINGEKYFDYVTGGNVQEKACDIARRCSFSLGCFYNIDEVDFRHPIRIDHTKEFMGRQEDHSRPQMCGGSDHHDNIHWMCSYHNTQMKNGNPFFDVDTLHSLFFA